MKGYRIAFIRHGMTQANLDGRYIGTTDLPLCREGADQLYEKIESTITLRCRRSTPRL